MEIGWYLRFARQDRIEALVDESALAQIRNHYSPDMGWTLETEVQEEGVVARFDRVRAK